ncbi:putative hydrolase/acyltransferase (alpha/beta hydrolase superfamily) [Handroanthus impetiginosus]|uniref:Putative hydrolase/acyltransferase (Alpha/beta hydrolase superfamily) n=1 Tax=Handroanthus impetiginosus TaxID=429701 RepID=A0A2G9HGB2_9LAMI|nr:putative hydrolase/acyltransferase (alpha/beta hydrolase superfamily) [Handroanthus impetiginosus]
MVNIVAGMMPLLRALMKKAGIEQHTVEIVPGTIVNIWVPSETIKKPNKSKKTTTSAAASPGDIIKPSKPVVVLLHGFVGDGIITWPFQVASLSKKYSVYVPDFLFFGGSTTDSSDRSPTFQAECLVKALRKLGIERCTVVGFSYGGMVAFRMAELYPELVEAVVASGAVPALTESITDDLLNGIGFSSLPELLLPNTVQGCKRLLRTGADMKLWFPDRAYKDFLEVMFDNRKERTELLQELIVSDKGYVPPRFPQVVYMSFYFQMYIRVAIVLCRVNECRVEVRIL